MKKRRASSIFKFLLLTLIVGAGVVIATTDLVGGEVKEAVQSCFSHLASSGSFAITLPRVIAAVFAIAACLWIACFYVDVRKLQGALPTLRVNNTWVECEYQGIVHLTSVDFELMLSNYIIHEIIFIEGYRWAHSDDRLFNEYVSYWGERKMQDKGGKRQIDKIMLNSSYGKFGLNPDRIRKYAWYDEKNRIVKYPPYRNETGDKDVEHDKCNNVAIAAFVTAYARAELNKGVNASTGFCYCDTDSVHLATFRIPGTNKIEYPSFTGEVHPTKLGAWKLESQFVRARYLRQKTYIEEERYGDFEVKACGMPQASKDFVRWDNLADNFNIGASFPGKLLPQVRPGGIELVETNFTIQDRPRWSDF